MKCIIKYMDLQMDIEGCEDFKVPSSYCQDEKGFDDAADIGFGDGPVGDLGHLGGSKFALFLAGEPHMPTLSNGSCTHVKKAVFKISEQRNIMRRGLIGACG